MSGTTKAAGRTGFTSLRRVLGVLAVALVAQAVTAQSADAALVRLEFVSTGATLIAAVPGPLSGGGIAGTWDDTTGDFVGGTMPFDPITIPATPPVFPTEGFLTIGPSDELNVTGTIDPATGEAQLTAATVVSIYIPAIDTTCTTSSFDITFTTGPPGQPLIPVPFDDSSELSIVLEGTMTVPAFDVDTGCVPVSGVAVMINGPFGFPLQWGLSLPLEGASIPAPPSTTSTTSTTSAPVTTTTAGSNAATQPRFAG